MICYGLRVYWTNTYPLDGLQGRYFLPLLPFMVVALQASCFSRVENNQAQFSSELLMHLDQRLSPLAPVVLLLSVFQLIFYIMNILHFYSVPTA